MYDWHIILVSCLVFICDNNSYRKFMKTDIYLNTLQIMTQFIYFLLWTHSISFCTKHRTGNVVKCNYCHRLHTHIHTHTHTHTYMHACACAHTHTHTHTHTHIHTYIHIHTHSYFEMIRRQALMYNYTSSLAKWSGKLPLEVFHFLQTAW